MHRSSTSSTTSTGACTIGSARSFKTAAADFMEMERGLSHVFLVGERTAQITIDLDRNRE